jgi:hypothetical protein
VLLLGTLAQRQPPNSLTPCTADCRSPLEIVSAIAVAGLIAVAIGLGWRRAAADRDERASAGEHDGYDEETPGG